MPYGARSIAAARTKLFTPPLWNAYAQTPAVPDQPLEEETQTIEPLMPRSAIARPTYLVLRKVPIAETITARWNASAVSSSTPRPPDYVAARETKHRPAGQKMPVTGWGIRQRPARG